MSAKACCPGVPLLTRCSHTADGKDAIVFKVKKTTMFKKIMDTYASNTGQAVIIFAQWWHAWLHEHFVRFRTRTYLQLTSLRFVFDDKTIKEDDSPKMVRVRAVAPGPHIRAQASSGKVALISRCLQLEMEDDDQVDVCIMQIGGSNT